MNIIRRGSLLPFLQNESWDFDPQRGYIYRAEYRGADPANVLALQQDYARAGIPCRLINNQGGTATLEVDDPTQQFTLDTWQLLGNDEARDGFSSASLSAGLIDSGYNPETIIAKLRAHLENNDDPDVLFTDGGDLDAAPLVAEEFYRLAIRGSVEFRASEYVLRHTTNAPSNWASNVSDFGVNMIYTPAQLLSEILDTSLWILPCPQRLAYKIANIPFPQFQPNYQWGWLKGTSTEVTAAYNRVEITTHYTLEQWSTWYYQPY